LGAEKITNQALAAQYIKKQKGVWRKRPEESSNLARKYAGNLVGYRNDPRGL